MIPEASNVLSDRKLFPSRISDKELEALKLAIAKAFSYPITEDSLYNRMAEEWIAMEDVLKESFLAVFHNYKAENEDRTATIIVMVAPTMPCHFQLWQAYEENLSDLGLVEQADEMRD